jgi:hypothetical protein
MHEKKLADDHGNGHQPINKPRKGSAEQTFAPAAKTVKRGGNRQVRIYRCETTGRVGRVSEHVKALCAEFTRANPETIANAIYRAGTWYGRRFTLVSGEPPVPSTVSGRMRALLATKRKREWTEHEFSLALGLKGTRVRHAARALISAGELSRIKPRTYRVLSRAAVPA